MRANSSHSRSHNAAAGLDPPLKIRLEMSLYMSTGPSFPRKREPSAPRARTVPPVHARGRLWTPAKERVKELKDGWICTVRPSRQPRCGFLRISRFLSAINNVPHGEERRRRVSNHARRPCRTRLSFRDQFLHTLFPPGRRNPTERTGFVSGRTLRQLIQCEPFGRPPSKIVSGSRLDAGVVVGSQGSFVSLIFR